MAFAVVEDQRVDRDHRGKRHAYAERGRGENPASEYGHLGEQDDAKLADS